MRHNVNSYLQQLQVSAALDVQSVERELSELWKENAGALGAAGGGEDGAMIRVRVMNLMVYVTTEAALREVNELLGELSARHPCRALVMLAEPQGADRDIEMFVSTSCPVANNSGARKLCSEQVSLSAGGRFAVELPSAATPLLVSDLPTFLWWRAAAPPRSGDSTFRTLARASDRVVIDSAKFLDPYTDLAALNTFLQDQENASRRSATTMVSDLNWARLTTWRALLADFYDVPGHLEALEHTSRVLIDFVAPQESPSAVAAAVVAPKALLLAGWLASRLNWRVAREKSGAAANDADVRSIALERDGRTIRIEFRRVSRPEMSPGSLARVELRAADGSSLNCVVSRNRDNRHLETRVAESPDVYSSRVLPCGDKSEAELLGRELEIINRDLIYERAVEAAIEMLEAA